jgi:hypothetical protein
MTRDPAAAVARAVLYEGYVLWPYRKSALKNQRRWTFGCVLPRTWSRSGHPDDLWRMRAECLLVAPANGAALRARARFLQVVDRRVARLDAQGLEFVEEIAVGRERWVAWEEARERELAAPLLEVRQGAQEAVPVRIPQGIEAQWIEDATGRRAAAVVRGWRELEGELRVKCERISDQVFRVGIELLNVTPWCGPDREDALRSSFASAHLVLEALDAELVSLTEPPAYLADAAGACEQVGCWPVLVGERGARDRMLASPIILPDYPAVAPESPGDLFDGGEIDELLTLHVLALSEQEKEEMRATDPRTREILERTMALGDEQLRALHGARRDGESGDPLPRSATSAARSPFSRGGARRGLAEGAPDPFWREMGRPGGQRVVVDGTTVQRGSRVRLRPRRGGDVMDVALAGRTAIVEGIDEDDTGGVHLSVVVEGDPGRDLGMERLPGHRFFFRPEEVEPLEEAGA